MMQSGIYVITNTVNGKAYVGKATRLKARKSAHFSSLRLGKHANSYLQAAWKKHGEDSFSWSILEYCPIDQLVERETWWMEVKGTKDRKKGYNRHDPVTGPLGIKHSAAARAKMAAGQKGHQNALGYRHTPESKARIGAASVGNQYAKGSQSWVGRKHTPESRERMSAALQGRPSNWVGRTHSTEARAKMSAAARRRPNNFAGQQHTPEARQRMSEAAKAREARKRQPGESEVSFKKGLNACQ